MADKAPDQHHKRHDADKSADKSIISSNQEVPTRKRQERARSWSPESAETYESLVTVLKTRKRQKRKQRGSPKSAEWYEVMKRELNAKPSGPVATDKSEIEQQLHLCRSLIHPENVRIPRKHRNCCLPKPERVSNEMSSIENILEIAMAWLRMILSCDVYVHE